MTIVGVTGGVGTGKSTVARMFAERLGAEVLDADRITHELMRSSTPVLGKIKTHFGKEVFTPSGQIDRRKLGTLVFKSTDQMTVLCRIIHPAVRRRIQDRLRVIRRQNPKAGVVLDIPLLVEAGSAYKLDWLVVASAPLKVIAHRLRNRSGWDLGEIRRRKAFQMPLHRKEQMADFVVDNSGSLAATRRQVATIAQQIIKRRQG